MNNDLILYQKEKGKIVSKYVKNICFDKKYDLIVAGLGCAGSFAAISAAREGISVLGIERSNCMGGMSTQGSVNGYYYGFPRGIFEEIDNKCKDLFSSVYVPFGFFHPEPKKYLIEKYCVDAGVDINYETVIIGIYMQGTRVVGVRQKTKEGIFNIECKMLIDATSDGHVISMCGCETYFGRSTDGKPAPFSSVRVFMRSDDRIGRTNHDSGYINQYDIRKLSKGIIVAHSNHISDIKNSEEKFLYIAPQIGIREGIRFKGEETLILEDVLNGKTYEKILFYAYSDIDKHGADTVLDEETYQDWYVISNLSTVTVRIPVPLGAIVPKGIKGIISGGRCLSADCYVSSAIRMNRDMYRLGEAEGLAAAMCIQSGKDILEIDYDELKQRLIARGCFDPEPDKQFGFDYPDKNKEYQKVEWMTDTETIKNALSTDTPGVAIWSCRRLGNSVADFLYEIMNNADNLMLKYNCAIALGIIKDKRALPVLREIVKNRSSFFFKDCRRTNQLRSVIAICLLGRFRDIKSIDILSEIVFEKEEYNKLLYHEIKEPLYVFSNVPGFNAVYFQHFTHAVYSLVKIAESHPEIKDDIFRKIKLVLSEDWYIENVTKKSRDTSEYQTIADVGKYILKIIQDSETLAI